MTLGALALLLLFGLPWAIRVWNETRSGVDPESDTPEDLLTPLVEAFQAGQMSEEEYLRIRASIERVANAGEPVTLPIDYVRAKGTTPRPPAPDAPESPPAS